MVVVPCEGKRLMLREKGSCQFMYALGDDGFCAYGWPVVSFVCPAAEGGNVYMLDTSEAAQPIPFHIADPAFFEGFQGSYLAGVV